MCVCVLYLFFIYVFAEKLYNSKGRELRRALFSLKQIFQVRLFLYYCIIVHICLLCHYLELISLKILLNSHRTCRSIKSQLEEDPRTWLCNCILLGYDKSCASWIMLNLSMVKKSHLLYWHSTELVWEPNVSYYSLNYSAFMIRFHSFISLFTSKVEVWNDMHELFVISLSFKT